jgi:hypothetical protein
MMGIPIDGSTNEESTMKEGVVNGTTKEDDIYDQVTEGTFERRVQEVAYEAAWTICSQEEETLRMKETLAAAT